MDAAIASNPNLWRAHNALGVIADRNKNFELAQSHYRDAYNETGAIAMNNGDYKEALQYLNEAVRVSPTYFAQAEKNIAEILKLHGQASPTTQ